MTACEHEESCRNEFHEINRKLDQVLQQQDEFDRSFRGTRDGKQPGIFQRVDRLENLQSQASKAFFLTLAALVMFAADLVLKFIP
jgi:hypothetical protein